MMATEKEKGEGQQQPDEQEPTQVTLVRYIAVGFNEEGGIQAVFRDVNAMEAEGLLRQALRQMGAL